MGDAYGMNQSSRDAVQRGLNAIKSKTKTPGHSFGNLATGVTPNAHADGICYGAISARSDISTPTAGYVKLDRLNTSPLGFVDPQDDPTRVFNISSHDFADGDRVRVYWHQNGVEGTGEDRIQLGYWTVGDEGGESAPRAPLFLCKTDSQLITTDTETAIDFGYFANFDHTIHLPYHDDITPLVYHGARLIRPGYYMLGYDIAWEVNSTSPGDPGAEISTGTFYLSSGDNPGSMDVVPCTIRPHQVYHDKTNGIYTGGNASVRALFHISAPKYIRLFSENGSATHNRSISRANMHSEWITNASIDSETTEYT